MSHRGDLPATFRELQDLIRRAEASTRLWLTRKELFGHAGPPRKPRCPRAPRGYKITGSPLFRGYEKERPGNPVRCARARARERSELDIPAQPLGASLESLAKQLDVNIAFDPTLVALRDAPALKRLLHHGARPRQDAGAHRSDVSREGHANDRDRGPNGRGHRKGPVREAQRDAQGVRAARR